jgi:hypothetical protein
MSIRNLIVVVLSLGLVGSSLAFVLTDRRVKELQTELRQHSELLEHLESLENQIKTLSKDLEKILDIRVEQFYTLKPSFRKLFGVDWTLRLEIPLKLYWQYKKRERPPLHEYAKMAKDKDDRPYIRSIVQSINELALKEGFTEKQKVEFVIAFVQSLPYMADISSAGLGEYPRYPIETLFERMGDCEDTSILAAALLWEMGYDVALIALPMPHPIHMAVGVALTGDYGSYFEEEGKKYFYVETTAAAFGIGKMPERFENVQACLYPLSRENFQPAEVI